MNGSDRGKSPGHRPVVAPTTTDRWRVAREHVQSVDRQRRNARLADQLMPIAAYYAGRPLRAVPLGQYLAEGWAS
jgi:hypothetical protein